MRRRRSRAEQVAIVLFQTIPGFLGSALNAQLLAYACAQQEHFHATGVGVGSSVRPSTRVSRRLTDLGEFRQRIEAAVLERVPDLVASLRLSPFQPNDCEIEIVAHEDGAYYNRHIDVFTDEERQKCGGDRLLSLVYYFFREPRAFDGGELRLFQIPRMLPSEPDQVDVVPVNDCAIVFSSWIPHEVRPIRCPSGDFADARFAINCWVRRARP